MAEDNDQESQTELPSARRLQQAYDEGQLPLSRDLAGVVGFGAAIFVLMQMLGKLQTGVFELIATATREVHRTPFDQLKQLMVGPLVVTLIVSAAAAIGSGIATFAQTRGGFWAHLALPDLTRVFEPSRLTRLFSKEMMVDLGMNALKLAGVSWILWSSLKIEFLSIERLLSTAPGDQLVALFRPLWDVAVKVLAFMAAIAGADFAINRHRFMKKNMMTKEEAKREYKEDEGDPLIRSRRRRKHRELAKGRAQAEVPRADALLVNPTHIAVAIRYRKDEGMAPRVLAKGKGQLAEYMRELARENGIPIIQDIPLARLLYRKVKVGKSIPAETYKAVAAILAVVYRMSGRAGTMGASR